MFCSICGHEFSETDAQFCPACGHKISHQQTKNTLLSNSNASNKAPVKSNNNNKQKKSNKKLVIAIACVSSVLIIGLIVLLCVLLFSSPKDAEHSVKIDLKLSSYDKSTFTRIPLHVSSKDKEDNPIDLVFFATLDDSNTKLKPGKYHLEFPASPLCEQGDLYACPKGIDFEIPDNLAKDDVFEGLLGNSYTFNLIEPAKITDSQIEIAGKYAELDKENNSNWERYKNTTIEKKNKAVEHEKQVIEAQQLNMDIASHKVLVGTIYTGTGAEVFAHSPYQFNYNKVDHSDDHTLYAMMVVDNVFEMYSDETQIPGMQRVQYVMLAEKDSKGGDFGDYNKWTKYNGKKIAIRPTGEFHFSHDGPSMWWEDCILTAAEFVKEM